MPNNEDFFQVIGRISVFFATWDIVLTNLILRLVDPATVKCPMNERTTLGQKIEIIEQLQPDQVVNPPVLQDLKLLLPKAKPIAQKRNRFIHDQWVFRPEMIAQGKIERIEITSFGVLAMKTVIHQATLEDLCHFSDEVRRIQEQFLNIINRLPLDEVTRRIPPSPVKAAGGDK